VRQAIVPIWTNDRGPDEQFDSEVVGYEVKLGAPKEDLEEARRAVAGTCQPGASQTIAAELQRMRALTKSKAEPSVDASLAAAALFHEVSAYPTDVVVDACRKWSARETFFPSWAELKDMLERGMRKRRALLRAIESAIEKADAPPTEPEVTIEERQRVGKLMGDLLKTLSAGRPRSDPEAARERIRRAQQEASDKIELAKPCHMTNRRGQVIAQEGPTSAPAVDDCEGWGS
jgi:hypothetical protein